MLDIAEIKRVVTSKMGIRKIREKLIEAERCNGWSNQETWTMHLWLSNEQGTYDHARVIARIGKGEHPYNAADRMREYCDDLAHQRRFNGTMFYDLIMCTFARCNWFEVAAAFRED